MDSKLDEVLKNYDFEVTSKSRVRGAILMETNAGYKLLKETKASAGRLVWENSLKNHLRKKGFNMIDAYCLNKEGNISTPDVYGNRYTVSDWYIGNECNLRDIKEVYLAAENLSMLHLMLESYKPDNDFMKPVCPHISETLVKHNCELRRIKNYLRLKKDRNEFEVELLKAFYIFYPEAEKAMIDLANIRYISSEHIKHGAYTYHNIIMCKEGIATTAFEKSTYGPWLLDLYYFLRKVMEKNDWNYEYGMAVINGYESMRKLEEQEKNALKCLLLYPEKFWKLASYYMNGKKTWISQKNLEKLMAIEEQREVRHKFIDEIS